jgi:hypothetical protein
MGGSWYLKRDLGVYMRKRGSRWRLEAEVSVKASAMGGGNCTLTVTKTWTEQSQKPC